MPKNEGHKTIHFWFGEDDFSMLENLKDEKEKFGKKFGSTNIYEIDWEYSGKNEQEKMSDLETGLASDSLFSSNKMLILKNVLFSSKKRKEEKVSNEDEKEEKGAGRDLKLLKFFQKPKEGVELFIIESEVDQRKKVFKELSRMEKEGIVEMKEFFLPVDRKFDEWIMERIERYGGKIGKEALGILSVSLGKGFSQKDRSKKVTQSYNLWEADNEIGKLVSYALDREITKEDISLLVRSKVDMNIFNLMDSISQKNRKKSILLLNDQIEKGLNEIYILTMLIRQFRNLLIIKNLLEEGFASSQIAQRTKIHPFVVSKTIDQSRNFSLADIGKIYQKLYDADSAIKTGKMDPNLALDLLVVSIA